MESVYIRTFNNLYNSVVSRLVLIKPISSDGPPAMLGTLRKATFELDAAVIE